MSETELFTRWLTQQLVPRVSNEVCDENDNVLGYWEINEIRLLQNGKLFVTFVDNTSLTVKVKVM